MKDIQKRIEELEWIYSNLNEILKDEEDLGETDIANRLYGPICQLGITIDSIKMNGKKG